MHQITTTEKMIGKTRAMIDAYLSLPIGEKPNCPYFNNRRKKIRGSLRVDKGKGTPKEIAEECQLKAKFARVKISELSREALKEFLIKNDLGVDCSGFAYHVLNTFCQEKTGRNLSSFVKPLRKGFVGSLIARLRPAENIGVSTFDNEKNSRSIKVSEAKPGDVIIFMGTGRDHEYNHILVITEVGHENDQILISYTHSYAWPSDGLALHGVREGKIVVNNENILNGIWTERDVTSNENGADNHGENFTFESAKNARVVSVKRLGFNSL